MNRRQCLALFGSSIFSGCLNYQDLISRDENTATSPPSSTMSVTTHETTVPPTKGKTDIKTTITETTVDPVEPRLLIRCSASKVTVLMTLLDWDTNETEFERSYSLESGDEIELDSHIEQGADYLFRITVEGDIIYDRPLFDYESYILDIKSKKKVEIVQYAEV